VTILAPFLGWLLYRRKASVLWVSLLAIVVVFGCILFGIAFPLRLHPETWKLIFSLYTFVAAGIPVWMILQPRDFTNSFLLYAGIIALTVAILVAGIRGIPMQLSGANVSAGVVAQGPLWPMLFILIACGAISGFHGLVAGGTSSKQIARESHARGIGYGGMVLEGILALGVIIAIAVGLDSGGYMRIMYPTVEGMKQNPILAFAVGMGSLLNKSLGFPMYVGTIFGVVMVEGFIATTLDTAVRLNRYLFEELWRVVIPNPPAFLRSYFFNAALAVVLMFFLARSNALRVIWPVFGAGNQPAWFVIIPAVFMLATTVTALLWLLFTSYIPGGQTTLVIADILLLALAAGAVVISLRSIILAPRKAVEPAAA
jgi:carbon starvation protein